MELSIAQLTNVNTARKLLGRQGFLAVTVTPDEISLVVESKYVEKHWKVEHGWSAFKVEGVLDFSLTGVLSGVLEKLAEADISVFTISTYNTDYILVKTVNKTKALRALEDDYEIVP